MKTQTEVQSISHLLIDRSALAANYQFLDRLVGPQTEVSAVVKADGYGHGLETASQAFFNSGCRTFCVAAVEEAMRLRKLFGDEVRVLKMTPSLPDEFEAINEMAVEETLVSWEQASNWEEWLSSQGKIQKVHLKIDVGMGRLGFPVDEFWPSLDRIEQSSFFEVAGLMGHLPASEEPSSSEADFRWGQSSETEREVERFRFVAEEMKAFLGRPVEKHLANSGAALFHPESRFDLVRSGLALYGVDPRAEDGIVRGLVPAMGLRSQLIQVRNIRAGTSIGYGRCFTAEEPLTVGVIPIGYAQGIPRNASPKIEVLVGGKRCRVLGNVSMSLITVDLSGFSEPQLGEPVVLLGAQGKERITVEDLSRWAGMIPYEILTTVGRLVATRSVLGSH